jgi:hypothetical protein
MANDRLAWWLSVRDKNPDPAYQRRGDILYGVIKLYKFPKTYFKLRNARHKTKTKKGLNDVASRLSHRLKINGPKWLHYHFTSYSKTVKGIRFSKKLWQKPKKKWVDYGRRHQLIISPRIDRHIKKHGPLGG